MDALICFGIEPAEFSVGTGVAEVEDELILRHLHLYCISSRRREAHFRPGAASQNAEAEEENDRRGGPDEFHRVVATRKVSALAMVAEAPHGIGKAQLREDEYHRRDPQRQAVLLVNRAADIGDRRRRAVKLRGEDIHRHHHHNHLQQRQQRR